MSTLTVQQVKLFEVGYFSHVPMIIGDVSDEGRMFVYPDFPTPPPRSEYEVGAVALFGAKAGAKVSSHAERLIASQCAQVLEHYPFPQDNDTFDCRDNLDQINAFGARVSGSHA